MELLPALARHLQRAVLRCHLWRFGFRDVEHGFFSPRDSLELVQVLGEAAFQAVTALVHRRQLLGYEALQHFLAVANDLGHLVRHWVEEVLGKLRMYRLRMCSADAHE